jgi:hypothetical protein
MSKVNTGANRVIQAANAGFVLALNQARMERTRYHD